MSFTGDRTFNDLIDILAGYIVTNCCNIGSNYDDTTKCPGTIKNKAKIFEQTYTNGGGHSESIIISVSETGGVSKVDKNKSNIINDIKNYKTNNNNKTIAQEYCNGNPPEKVSREKFIGFFNNIISFCEQRLEFVTGNFATTTGRTAYRMNMLSNSYLAYKNTSDNTYKYSDKSDAIIYADEVLDILGKDAENQEAAIIGILKDVITNTARCRITTLEYRIS